MTNPMENAPWWNMLFETAALPAVNALLPFALAAILLFVFVGIRRALKLRQKQRRSPE
jgi:uncharacterized integral membrane protein